SNLPKLQSAEKALLIQLAQTGTLNLESPQNKLEFNRRLGVVGFDNEVGPDVKRAEWENDLMDNAHRSPDNQPVLLFDENHEVHLDVHLRRMKEPDFVSLPEEVQQAYQRHVEAHNQALEQKKMMLMLEAQTAGGGAVMESGPQINTKSQGPGLPKELEKQVVGADIPKRMP